MSARVVGMALLTGLWTVSASAQSGPGSGVSVGTTLYTDAELTEVGEGRVGEMQVQTYDVSISHGFSFNDGQTRLATGFAYQRMNFEYQEFSTPLSSVQSIAVSAFLTQKLNERWGLLLVAAPNYAEDFEGSLSLDALTLTAVAAGTYRFSPRLEMGLGVAMQNVFGEPLPLPVASVDWAINDHLWFESILPLNAMLTWLPMPWLGLRAEIQVMGNSYHGDPDVYGVGNPQLNYSAVMAGGGARFFLLPWLHLTTRGGYTLHRRFEFSDGRSRIPAGEYELGNSPVFGIDLGVGG